MKRIIGLVGILLLAGSYSLRADEIQVVGSLDKDVVQVDDEISLTVRIIGSARNVQAPHLPAFQGFDSFYTGRTSQFTFVNGRSSTTVEFSYVLVPKVPGRYTLEPIPVWIEGKSFQTQPLQVEVLGPQVQTPQPVSPGPASQRMATRAPNIPTQAAPPVSPPTGPPVPMANDGNIFVKAAVDKQTVYPNEQILLTYTLYTRYDTRYEGFEEEPSVSGFWIEDFPLDRDLGRDTISMNGRRYMKADIRKIALFPTAAALYTIQPGTLKVSIQQEPKNSGLFDEFFGDSFFTGAGFFGRRMERLLKPEPISITVRPFPETGKPASFNGAVGHFELTASVDKNEIKQNEPVTLKLVLLGEGNIETLSRPPVPELTGFKVYGGDSSSQLFKSGGPALAGRKTFEIIFIPTEAGDLSIPPLEFSFFDPRRGRYEVLHTQPFPLRVIPSKEPARLPAELEGREAFQKEVSRVTQDIRYIHEEWPSESLPQARRYLYWVLAGANLVGLLLVANGWVRRRREEVLSRDEKLRRSRLARPEALRRLKELKRLARSPNPDDAEEFVEESQKVLSEYFANKFNISPYSFTKEWLMERLSGIWGADDSLLQQIREFYDIASETRFGQGSLLAEERRESLELIEKVIRRAEKTR